MGAEREIVIARLASLWGDPVRARGTLWTFAECEVFATGDMSGLAAVCLRDAPVAELVAINALQERQGIGTALLAAIVSSLAGFHSLRLSTTNDNLDALRFYQRRGFRLAALRPGAVDEARRNKPAIPEVGDFEIPMRDEIDLVLDLSELPAGHWAGSGPG